MSWQSLKQLRRPAGWLPGIAGTFAGLVLAVTAYALIGDVRFVQDFDAHVQQVRPDVAAILREDPVLRTLFLREMRAAFARHGWPAATARLEFLALKHIQAYADDDHIVACEMAEHGVMRALLDSPHMCHAYREGDRSLPRVRQLLALTRPQCEAAVADGGRRRHAGEYPNIASDADTARVKDDMFVKPGRLSAAELNVLQSGGDDRVECQAAVRANDNVAALPPQLAASYYRHTYTYPVILAADVDEPGQPGARFARAPALNCPLEGTLFTSSMESAAGRPITWMAHGQHGWDCSVRSSVTGERGLMGDLADNSLRLLWPLAVGKSADLATTTLEEVHRRVHYEVSGFDSFWLPFGQVHAYLLDRTISENGRLLYTLTHYWSPELGWKIGQRTRVWSGKWPEGTAPDWQLIAVTRPQP